MRLPRLVIRAYLLRGMMIWLTMRLVVSVVLLFGREDPLHLSAATSGALIGLTAVWTFFDMQRRNERILIGNLGLRSSNVSLLVIIPATIGELGVRLAASLIS